MGLLSIANYDMCVGCVKLCATCWQAGKQNDFYPEYPLDIDTDQMTVPNTYYRWIYSNRGVVRSFVRENFDSNDWDAQTRWMLEHPQVAYVQIDNATKNNDVKIAHILSWMWGLYFGVIPVLGGQQLGKTLTMLWFAENMHAMKKTKPICYFTHNPELSCPDWIKKIDDLNAAPNEALILVDEAAIRAYAGDHAKIQQKWLTQWLAIIGQKKLITFWPTQSLNILGKNPVRLLTALVLKPISDVAEVFGERDLIDRFKHQVPTHPTETTIWNPRPPGKFMISYWQPMPRFVGAEELRIAFADHDVTIEEKLFKVVPTLRIRKWPLVTCNQCGHFWNPRGSPGPRGEAPRPPRCPGCGSPDWDKPKILLAQAVETHTDSAAVLKLVHTEVKNV
jgi:hypothetical protein